MNINNHYCPDCYSDDLDSGVDNSIGIETSVITCCNGCRRWGEDFEAMGIKLERVFPRKGFTYWWYQNCSWIIWSIIIGFWGAIAAFIWFSVIGKLIYG